MNYSFEYIDIILLAMIAGFIFLRLRGILGRRTGHKESVDSNFPHDFLAEKKLKNKSDQIIFDEKAKEVFLKGAKIAYETVITNFASGNLKSIKYLLDKKVFDQFNESLRERENKGYMSETTFVGIDSASIKEHNKINSILEVTVDFVSEIISCVKDKDNKILSGDPEKVKKVFDTWKFKKDSRSNNPNWLLIDTQI
ncbi:MAG: Tim44 domain-containing protein [Pelagibacterales bacterium]|jgi:predicted lipid-binding transport protein (Tim44 family)|nr:Tim44 domain-containing protein [Pelagibacterales bacterium]|tara:strand:- start:138 stop:728 length:591 start_codon:yes stop_codon:yes gene_type:complete